MRFLTTLLLLLAFAVAQAAPTIPSDRVVIKFQTKLGIVTFQHNAHTARSNNCQTCHHTHAGTGQPRACHSCHTHEGTNDIPKVPDVIHLRCQGCHEANLKAGKPHGPLVKECKLCHVMVLPVPK